MAADPWRVYHTFKTWMADGTFDLDSNTLKVALFTSAGQATVTNLGNSVLANLSGEVAAGNGYTAGGVTAPASWSGNGSGTTTLDLTTDPSWTASGGTITARYAVLYAQGTLNGRVNPLISYCLLDNTPADVSVSNGNTLTITISASGVLQVSGG